MARVARITLATKYGRWESILRDDSSIPNPRRIGENSPQHAHSGQVSRARKEDGGATRGDKSRGEGPAQDGPARGDDGLPSGSDALKDQVQRFRRLPGQGRLHPHRRPRHGHSAQISHPDEGFLSRHGSSPKLQNAK